MEEAFKAILKKTDTFDLALNPHKYFIYRYEVLPLDNYRYLSRIPLTHLANLQKRKLKWGTT